MSNIPYIPENSPFPPEQRAWLNGFFAGLYSRTSPVGAPVPAPQTLRPLTVLFGSQTGNAETLARKTAAEAGKRGFAATVVDMGQYPVDQLKDEKKLLVLASTYGDGEPPDNGKALWERLGNGEAPKLEGLEYSILALGDSNYPKFCEFGKNLDERLEALGAKRVHARIDCDVDFDEPFQKWLDGVMPALSGSEGSALNASVLPKAQSEEGAVVSGFSKKNPFPARLLTNRKLNAEGSDKDTRHFEISLDGSGLNYEVGDALGVAPANCQEIVAEILKALGCDGEEEVPAPDGGTLALRKALVEKYEITKISTALLGAVAEKGANAALSELLRPESKPQLEKFLHGREVIDLLTGVPRVEFKPVEFVGLLKKLQPRLYSISSSPKMHPGEVHLTVAAVRYLSHGRSRKGVCSTFLADRVAADSAVPVYVHPNKNFRPPADPSVPMIMVGPGTGVAPFRAFLEDRRVMGATGKNWLFFGDQHAASDFLYQDELEAMKESGVLTRLDTAFSRDQKEKIYVQHRMLENSAEIFAWLEEGATFHVCGDATRMAKDVDEALHKLIEAGGGRTHDQAADYVKKMKADQRYQRDVY